MAEGKKGRPIEDDNIVLVRILGQDIRGDKNLYGGLTRVKGISWAISNIICKKLGFDKSKKIGELSKEDISKIEDVAKDLDVSNYLKNRNNDFDSGESKHLTGVNLDMKKDFDIKRLKQIKSYKGMRHALKLPVRGQRTRSNFRKTGIAVGVRKPKMGKKS
jgi:small subunit ribosomal protein S13